MSNNFVMLQGWLTLKASNLQTEQVDGQRVAYLRAKIDTDAPAVGGRHAVVLVGEGLDKARALLAMQGNKTVRVQAVVEGKLVTFRGASVVQSEKVVFVPAQMEVLS